mgnify:CR=1 FL=1
MTANPLLTFMFSLLILLLLVLLWISYLGVKAAKKKKYKRINAYEKIASDDRFKEHKPFRTINAKEFMVVSDIGYLYFYPQDRTINIKDINSFKVSQNGITLYEKSKDSVTEALQMKKTKIADVHVIFNVNDFKSSHIVFNILKGPAPNTIIQAKTTEIINELLSTLEYLNDEANIAQKVIDRDF